MSSSLAEYLTEQGDRGFHQFRLITTIKGVEFGSPVYTFDKMIEVLNTSGIDNAELRRISARKAGSQEWGVM